MGNCLVTKLKGSVQNDNLPYLGGLTINVHASENPVNNSLLIFLSPRVGKTLTVKPVGGYIEVGGVQRTDPVTISAETYITFENKDFYVVVNDKYDIAGISGGNDVLKHYSIDLSQVNEFCTDIYLGMFGITTSGEVSYLGNQLNTTEGVDTSVVNLNEVKISDNFFSLNKHTNVSGSIRVFDNKLHVGEITLPFLGNVIGEVKDLLDAQVANGRTSNTLSLQLANTSCTLNGTLITYESLGGHWNIIVTFDSSAQGGYTIEYT